MQKDWNKLLVFYNVFVTNVVQYKKALQSEIKKKILTLGLF